MGIRVLVVDNYDSFVFNLVQYLGQLGAECVVRRNDEVTVTDVLDGDLDGGPVAGVLLSPGPGNPESAGVCLDLVRQVGGVIPLLGVCLGHQAIATAFGATVRRAPELLHGKTSEVTHDGVGILAGLPNPFTATRYHSLSVVPETMPVELEVTGWSDTGIIMALRHRELPIEGVQFHPESVLTQAGHAMLANWLNSCGYPQALDRAPALVSATEERRLLAYQ